MIALGVRLAVAGGRRNAALLAVTAVAVAAGTVLLLLALCVAPAVQARADRTAWLSPLFGPAAAPVVAADSPVPHTTVMTSRDHFGPWSIDVAALAGSGPDAPLPPHLSALPAPGQALVSPALAELMADEPELADRYGQVTGTLDLRALAGPETLLAVRGAQPSDVSYFETAVTAFPTRGDTPDLTPIVRIVLLLAAVALLAPIALLIAMTTRLTAATRDRRLAALRLAGATSRQVAQLAAVESALAGVGGVLAGIGLFFTVRPLATGITFYDDEPWFTSDLTPSPLAFAAVLLGVPLVVAAATQLTLRRVATSPLGVARRTTGRPVRAWRVLPLAVAVPALVVAFTTEGSRAAIGSGNRSMLLTFGVLLLTLVYAGPWITRACGLLLARSDSPARLLAGRRLADHPSAGFTAVAGVVLAVLITTVFAATTPAAAESVADTRISGQHDGTAQVSLTGSTSSAATNTALLRQIRAVPGVRAATLVYTALVQDGSDPTNAWIGDCGQIQAAIRATGLPCGQASVLVATNRQHLVEGGRAVELGNLAAADITAGADRAAMVDATQLVPASTVSMPAQTGIDTPGLIIEPSQVAGALAQLRPTLILTAYDTDAALEQVRSLVQQRTVSSQIQTRQTTFDGFSSGARQLYRTLTVAALAVFAVAALGLVIALAAGLLERRRPFALLRASGTPLQTLRATTMLEVAVPLLVMATLATVLGALVGHLTISATGTAQSLPWADLSTPVAAGVGLTLVLVSCAAPLVRRTTSTEETRFD